MTKSVFNCIIVYIRLRVICVDRVDYFATANIWVLIRHSKYMRDCVYFFLSSYALKIHIFCRLCMYVYAGGRVAHATQPIDLYIFFCVTYLSLHRTDSLYYGYLVLGSFPLVSDLQIMHIFAVIRFVLFLLTHVHARTHIHRNLANKIV